VTLVRIFNLLLVCTVDEDGLLHNLIMGYVGQADHLGRHRPSRLHFNLNVVKAFLILKRVGFIDSQALLLLGVGFMIIYLFKHSTSHFAILQGQVVAILKVTV